MQKVVWEMISLLYVDVYIQVLSCSYLPVVSKGINMLENIANIHKTENSIYEFKILDYWSAPQIHGMKIPPVLPMPLASPIPVVLNLVG